MQAHGQGMLWGTHVGVGRARHSAGWRQPLRQWWAAHKAERQRATLGTIRNCWDAKHEAFRPLRAEAASDMAAAQSALSVVTRLYGLL
jgi:hypothetical protein